MATQVRVPGHSLIREGHAHDDRGRELGGWRGDSPADGRGKCSCGALSDVLRSRAARKRWHAAHKAEVLARGEG